MQWRAEGHTSPPVMLTVCNRTETAGSDKDYEGRLQAIVEATDLPEDRKTRRT